MAPSSRMVSPFIIGLSTIAQIIWAKCEGSPSLEMLAEGSISSRGPLREGNSFGKNSLDFHWEAVEDWSSVDTRGDGVDANANSGKISGS